LEVLKSATGAFLIIIWFWVYLVGVGEHAFITSRVATKLVAGQDDVL
jgi:hypothetical protein